MEVGWRQSKKVLKCWAKEFGFSRRGAWKAEQKPAPQSLAVSGTYRCFVHPDLMLSARDGQVARGHVRLETGCKGLELCCCVLVAVGRPWGTHYGKMCTCRMGKVVRGPLYEERKECCGFFSGQRSLEWVYELGYKLTTMGVLFLCKKILRTEAFPDQTRVSGVLSSHKPIKAGHRRLPLGCASSNRFSPLGAASTLRPGSLQKCPARIASSLESVRQVQAPLIGSGGISDLFLTYLSNLSSHDLFLKAYSSATSIALSDCATPCFAVSLCPGQPFPFPRGHPTLMPSFYLPCAQ